MSGPRHQHQEGTPQAVIWQELQRRDISAAELARRLGRKQSSIARAISTLDLTPGPAAADIFAALDLAPALVPAGAGELYRVALDDDAHRAAFNAMTPEQRGQLISAALSLRGAMPSPE